MAGPSERTAAEQLVAIARALASGQREALETALHELAESRRRAAARDTTHELPRLASLLAAPSFADLRRFLDERRVDVDQLQRMIDELVDRDELPSPKSALERRLEPLIAAASSGGDVDAQLEQLRLELLAEQPEREPELDAFIDQLRAQLASFGRSSP